jgi:hypothetical protein
METVSTLSLRQTMNPKPRQTLICPPQALIPAPVSPWQGRIPSRPPRHSLPLPTSPSKIPRRVGCWPIQALGSQGRRCRRDGAFPDHAFIHLSRLPCSRTFRFPEMAAFVPLPHFTHTVGRVRGLPLNSSGGNTLVHLRIN